MAKKTKQSMGNVTYYLSKIVLFIVFFGIGKLLTVYEENSPSLGEFFYPVTVIIGLIVGIVFMTGLFFIEQKAAYIKEKTRPKTWGIVLITGLVSLTIILAVAGIIVSMLWHPDTASYAAFTYLFGVIPAVAAVCIMRYLPHILPQKDADDESFSE